MTCITVVQADLKGARHVTNIASLKAFAKNNGLYFREDPETGKEDRSVLYDKKTEKVSHVLFSFDHTNVKGPSDKTNPNAYHDDLPL